MATILVTVFKLFFVQEEKESGELVEQFSSRQEERHFAIGSKIKQHFVSYFKRWSTKFKNVTIFFGKIPNYTSILFLIKKDFFFSSIEKFHGWQGLPP